MRSTPASDDGKSQAAAFADDDDKSKPAAILKTASAFASNRASRAAAFAFAGDVISAAAESQAPAFAFAGDGESKQQLCLQVMAKNLHLQLQAERGKAPPPDQCHCNSSRASHVGTDVEVQEVHEDGSPGVKLCLAVVAAAALRRAAKSRMMLKQLLLGLRLVLLVS
jgi:hypothetical protein